MPSAATANPKKSKAYTQAEVTTATAAVVNTIRDADVVAWLNGQTTQHPSATYLNHTNTKYKTASYYYYTKDKNCGEYCASQGGKYCLSGKTVSVDDKKSNTPTLGSSDCSRCSGAALRLVHVQN